MTQIKSNKKVSTKPKNKALKQGAVSGSLLADIRQAVADYIATEGCSCCRDTDGHDKAMERLGKLIKMKKYDDNSGFDYGRYRSKQ